MRQLSLALVLLFAPHALARVVGWSEAPTIRRVIDATRAPVAGCVEDYGRDTDRDSLSFWAQLRVAPDGSIANVTFDRDGLLNDGQRYCVRRTLEALQFPPPHAEQRLPIHYVVEQRAR